MITCALYGGSFDPVHRGHISLAEQLIPLMDLDEIIFLPAGRSPLKDNAPVASAAHRLAMLKTALSSNSALKVSDFDLKQDGPSYTINTLKYFSRPDRKLYWILGDDQLMQLEKWHDYPRHFDFCDMIVLPRHHAAGLDAYCKVHPYGKQLHPVHTGTLPVSSTEIRDLCAANGDVSPYTGSDVSDYIKTHQLYR